MLLAAVGPALVGARRAKGGAVYEELHDSEERISTAPARTAAREPGQHGSQQPRIQGTPDLRPGQERVRLVPRKAVDLLRLRWRRRQADDHVHDAQDAEVPPRLKQERDSETVYGIGDVLHAAEEGEAHVEQEDDEAGQEAEEKREGAGLGGAAPPEHAPDEDGRDGGRDELRRHLVDGLEDGAERASLGGPCDGDGHDGYGADAPDPHLRCFGQAGPEVLGDVDGDQGARAVHSGRDGAHERRQQRRRHDADQPGRQQLGDQRRQGVLRLGDDVAEEHVGQHARQDHEERGQDLEQGGEERAVLRVPQGPWSVHQYHRPRMGKPSRKPYQTDPGSNPSSPGTWIMLS